MSFFVIDIEADGPAPGLYSMIQIGCIKMQEDLESAPIFTVNIAPISDKFVPEALSVSGFSREETLSFLPPEQAMSTFNTWLTTHSKGYPIFISDNNGFDFAFVNYYFWRFLGHNPFGHSSRNLGDLYKGLVKNTKKNFKHLRKTKHTHNAVDDARGNAEALLAIRDMGLNINFD